MIEEDRSKTFHKLQKVGQHLHVLAAEHDLIVVITNQMTSRGFNKGTAITVHQNSETKVILARVKANSKECTVREN